VFTTGQTAYHSTSTSFLSVTLPSAAGTTFCGAWSTGEELWVAAGPSLHHLGPQGWSDVDADAGFVHLDVSGTSPSDVWAVGGADIRHFDGAAWSSSLTDAGELFAVAAWSPSAAFAAGLEGVVLRWDGQQWSSLPPVPFPYPGYHQVLALIPRGPNEVWALGHTLARWDGAEWESFSTGTPMLLTSGFWADGELWVAGQDGYLLHRPAL
jgi:hypothetical protein